AVAPVQKQGDQTQWPAGGDRAAAAADARCAGGRGVVRSAEDGGVMPGPAQARGGAVAVRAHAGPGADQQPGRADAAAGGDLAEEELRLQQPGGVPLRRTNDERDPDPAPARPRAAGVPGRGGRGIPQGRGDAGDRAAAKTNGDETAESCLNGYTVKQILEGFLGRGLTIN